MWAKQHFLYIYYRDFMTAALAEDKEDVCFFCFFVFQEKSRDPHQLVTHVKMLGTT